MLCFEVLLVLQQLSKMDEVQFQLDKSSALNEFLRKSESVLLSSPDASIKSDKPS
ncbi:hypothetical protein RUM4293_01572 [Ruegeria atlantica]|uniref:Uncharacterized protein n=1 Tax=Ruegeria atlantica TaxID=81569 RepID=A0A0P1E2Z9_9RHOB|nr:hypothetical protein RUM4293_01572 [Ruegeria atlantica]